MLAIGGLNAMRAAEVLAVGPAGIALMGSVMRSPDPAREVRALLSVLGHPEDIRGGANYADFARFVGDLARLGADGIEVWNEMNIDREWPTGRIDPRAYVEMLVDGEAADEETRREYYGIIQASTDRLGRLIDNMLNISRIEAGIIQIDREAVEMGAVIRRAVESLSPQALERKLALSFKGAPVDLTAEGDADMLYQVVLNLVSNAIESLGGQSGRVTVGTEVVRREGADSLVRLVVADTGRGIDAASKAKIFDDFYTTKADGTGLGLSIVRRLVMDLEGSIRVESEVGKGSLFIVELPAAETAQRVDS